MEDITDTDYVLAKRDCKDLEIKNLGEYHDLYVQSNTLLLADVSEKFQNLFLKIYEIDPACFLSAQELAWQVALKKAKVKLDLLTNGRKRYKRRNMSLYYRYAEANKKYMKDYDKNEKSSYLKYWDVNN